MAEIASARACRRKWAIGTPCSFVPAARLRNVGQPIALSAVAAGLSWLIARHLPGHRVPVFAPVAAFMVMGLTVGRHASRAVELMVGQAVGILCADLLVSQMGLGAVQVGLVVGVSMAAAALLGSGALLVQQAAISAVLVAGLQPPGSGLAGARLVDVVIGGAVAVAIKSLLFPTDPLELIPARGQALLVALAGTLADVRAALESMDADLADEALARARSLDELCGGLREAVQAGAEAVRLSPRRRRGRALVTTQRVVVRQLDLAVRNTRVLARRARRAVGTGAVVPQDVIEALRALEVAVREIDLAADRADRVLGADALLEAAGLANGALGEQQALSVTVLVAQVRSLVGDLLIAAGVGEEVALQAIDAA
jgi:uncharacterized membrane protein YgaE (UPF0421/DUF939 family)